MAKIDDYKRAKAHAESLRNFLKSSRDPGCDKFGASVKVSDTYKGYYGNSSCSAWPDAIVKAVQEETVLAFKELIERAVVKAERAAEKARREAADEAREVLADIEGHSVAARLQAHRRARNDGPSKPRSADCL
jgi:hypothetical protein